jgi:hypothetical protein
MAVLFELVSSGAAGTQRISLHRQNLEHEWKPLIASFASPSFETAEMYGGFVDMSWGQITVSPDVFASEWPPPISCNLTIYYTDTNEAGAVVLFSGEMHLSGFDEESVIYDIYQPEYDTKLLAEAENYDGDTVPLPRAFGQVMHVQPIRLPDVGIYPTYHLGGIGSATDSIMIESFTSAASGAKTKIICIENHGWSNGQSITINGTVNFNGTYVIESASGDNFVIPVAFPTDNSEQLPLHASAFTAGSFGVFDDGVPIQENVIDNGDGTFSLAAAPVGTVTISGTGQDTTLTEIVEWAQGELGITAYDDTYARATSPDVAYWATSQTLLKDFISSLTAFFSHYCYVQDDTLYLGDMLLDNGSETVDMYGFFETDYQANNAVKKITANWMTHEAVEERLEDGVSSAVYVKDVEHESAVFGNYLWGSELTIPPYHDIKSNIDAALTNIIQILESDQSSISLPITGALPNPGKKITSTNSNLIVDTTASIRARRIQFDFGSGIDSVTISGEGVTS